MDHSQSYADKKSRVFCYRANGKAPQMRSVGSVTIVSPEWETPLFLKETGFTIIFQEARQEGELREAFILLHRLKRPLLQSVLWFASVFVLGAAVTRWWYYTHYVW